MAWIKLDDQWMDHPKIIRAGRDGRDLWLASITYCAKHYTDGAFPKELLPALAVMAGIDVANAQQIASTLLSVCLWESDENNYFVHDYLHYNPTKEQAQATKAARAAAGRLGGKQKASKTSSKTLAKSWQKSAPSPSPSFNTLSSREGEKSPAPPSEYHKPDPPKKNNRKSDPRSKHPAILAFQGVTRRLPPLELYDEVITAVGDPPDGPKLAACWKEWLRRGHNPGSLAWCLEWYTTGIPDQPFRRNGSGQAPAQPRTLRGPGGKTVEAT